MNISELVASLRQANRQIPGAVRSVVYEESKNILAELKRRSPVSTGQYKSNWMMSNRSSAASGKIASVTFANRTPYAHWMEYGGEISGKPWNFPSKKQKVSRSLTVAEGRVWAGGITPGHHLTIGGATKPALLENDARQKHIAGLIGVAVVGVF